MLPNTPFNRRNLYPGAKVPVHPLTGIQLAAGELKRYGFSFVNNAQFNFVIARRRRNRMPMGPMNM